MKLAFIMSILASMAIGPAAAATPNAPLLAAQRMISHRYPIHYDGPFVRRGRPRPTAADVTGDLPKFNLTFHGGPVQTATTSYAIYWQPPGTYVSPRYKALINRYLHDIGGSAMYQVATEYYGSNGRVRNASTFGGGWTDTAPYPAKGVTDFDLQIEVLKAVLANTQWKQTVNSQFFVLTAKNAIPVSQVSFCAYHSAFDYGFPGQVTPFAYAFVPYLGYINGCNEPFGITPNNDADADGSILNLSHEQMEMVSDPLINAWYDENGNEVGDICIFSFGVPINNAFSANIHIGADEYFLQEMYSQAHQSCQPNL